MTEKKHTGVWLDKDTGKIVYQAPTRGRLIAAPGRPPTKSEEAAIGLFEENHATFSDEQATAPVKAPAKTTPVKASK